MKPKYLRILIGMVLMAFCLPLCAQSSREYIRNSIKEWGQCRNVAITRTNGDLALYGKNGYACSSVPTSLSNAIKELRNDSKYIDDIQLTENGNWLILYGDNGCRWSNIPYSLEKKIREYNNNNEVITSVTFNDSGDWIVISTEHISSSDGDIQNWLADGLERHGALWAACITDDCLVAVYENGYKFLGNVPEDLRGALRDTSLDVYRLKIAGTAWFFADKNGKYNYNM